MSTSNLDVQRYFGAFKATYDGTIGGNWAADILRVFESDSQTSNFPGIEEIAGLNTFDPSTGRTNKSITDFKIAISQTSYEDNVTSDRLTYLADKLDMLGDKVADMGIQAAYAWNDDVATLLSGGTSGASCFDGSNFFSATHPLSTGTQSNLLTSTDIPAADVATVATPTDVEAANIISQTLAYMMTLKGYNLKPINGSMRGLKFIVGDAMKYTAFVQAISKLLLTGSVSNPVTGFQNAGWKLSVELVPALTGAAIYAVRTDGTVKPFIGVENPAGFNPTFEGPDSYFTNQYDKVRFGITVARGKGYGRYQSAVKVTLS